jgi:CheY-like chemotaxis protein
MASLHPSYRIAHFQRRCGSTHRAIFSSVIIVRRNIEGIGVQCGLAYRCSLFALLEECRSLRRQTVTFDRIRRSSILVVDDVEETRDGIKRLLTVGGYGVSTARDSEESILKARLYPPDLILICLGLDTPHVLPICAQIRERAGLGEEIPIVAFCINSLEEGAEVPAGHNVYLTRPDNFDQLRAFVARLLRNAPERG